MRRLGAAIGASRFHDRREQFNRSAFSRDAQPPGIYETLNHMPPPAIHNTIVIASPRPSNPLFYRTAVWTIIL